MRLSDAASAQVIFSMARPTCEVGDGEQGIAAPALVASSLVNMAGSLSPSLATVLSSSEQLSFSSIHCLRREIGNFKPEVGVASMGTMAVRGFSTIGRCVLTALCSSMLAAICCQAANSGASRRGVH
eukprot:CAMPEP_0115289522 /NCGR_PEP_ID=MMETSP0270-20121206/63555_1 /TAXON_ID=71861 /ORGANISM="Scrippsiella trochoidea, Strain CCMP3099" /LENGTH=126 /DNA_ID=CAMNT_0002706709 /DNA_START=40 /DNA_END=421 /DNA_ORIENTATION=-